MKLQIKEALDSSIPGWLKDTIKTTRGWYGKTGPSGEYISAPRTQFGNVGNLDLNTTLYHELPVPKTSREFNQIMDSEDKVAVMRGTDERGKEFVYAARVNNPKIDFGGRNKKYASDVPVKYLLNMITDFGYLEVSPDVVDLRQSRRSNKPADRNRDRMDSYGYDKSGYPKTGLDKYKNILGEMGLQQYESILEDGFETYDTLNSMLRKFRNEPDKILDIRNMTNRFLDTLRQLQLDYRNTAEDEADPELRQRYARYARERAKPDILHLRKIVREMKQYLDNEIMG